MRKLHRSGFSLFACAFVSVVAVVFLVAPLPGCGGSSDIGSRQEEPLTPVFSTLELPADSAEAEEYFSDIEQEVDLTLERILTEPQADWDGAVGPLVHARGLLLDAQMLAIDLQSNADDPALRATAAAWYPRLKTDLVEIDLNQELYARVAPALDGEAGDLTPEQRLDRRSLFRDLRQLADSADGPGFLQNYQEYLNLSFQFYLNTLSAPAASATFTPEELACLPAETLAGFPTDDQGNYLYEGSPFTSLMISCLSDEVRARAYAVRHSRAAVENRPLWPQIVERRHEYALRLGYPDYASYRLGFNMMSSPEEIRAFLDSVDRVTEAPYRTLTDIYRQMQAEETGALPETLSVWNRLRYETELRFEQWQQIANRRSDYLEHDQTLHNLLKIAGELFGLRFESFSPSTPLWSSSIKAFRVFDSESGLPVGTLLFEPFGATGMTMIIEGRQATADGFEATPTVKLNTNLTPSDASETLYLSPHSLITLAHELGHALHYLLCRRYYMDLDFDFGELPSKFMEHFAQQPEVLLALLSDDPHRPRSTFPDGFEQWWRFMTDSGREAVADVRYNLALSEGFLEATSWQPGNDSDLGRIARENLAAYYFAFPAEAEPWYDVWHVAHPGYDAGYYLYLLGEVFAQDVVERFNEAPGGSLSPELGGVYRDAILERGSLDPQQAIRDFLGREMSFDAFEEHYRRIAEQW